jgi:hypothetical protein
VRFVPVALALAATLAPAQITAPLVGWLPAGTEVRPMNGFPAAATLGEPANVGHTLAHTTVSPSQNYVLASDAESGEVLLVVPGASATRLNTSVEPDQIVASPGGSSAALWFSGAAQFEILSGLPARPAIRQIPASFLNTGLTAMAVSEDGQWIAAACSAGVYQWGPDGVPHQLYGGGDAGALAFFAGSSTLAIATSTQLLSIAESGSSVLYQGSFTPAGLATSFDNQEIVLADRSGAVYSINSTTHAVSMVNCECRPSGVFGLGRALFRLTSSSIGAIKLFDAAAGTVLAVPGDSVKMTRRMVHPAQSTATLPTLTINLSPMPTGYLQQPAMTITASAPSASEIDGNVVLTFASSSSTSATIGQTDQTIQFSTGGTTVNFTIPAGSTKANFSGAPSVTFSTGTTAGTITLTANVTAPASTSAVATQTVTNKATFPTISSVQIVKTPGVVTVVVTGYSPTDDVISGLFTFALTSNALLNANDFPVPLSPYFQPYYATTASYATGSEFTLMVPFGIIGNTADITGVTVTLINSVASSNPFNSQ